MPTATGLGLPGEAPYDTLIQQASASWGVPAGLLAADLSVESGFHPDAKSPAGARGMAQFMPGTAREYGVDVTSPASSIDGQAHYLSDLLAQTGSWDAALTRYSGGTPGYAEHVMSLWKAHDPAAGSTTVATGGTSPAASSSGDPASVLTTWLDSVAARVGMVLLGGALVLVGLHKMAQ